MKCYERLAIDSEPDHDLRLSEELGIVVGTKICNCVEAKVYRGVRGTSAPGIKSNVVDCKSMTWETTLFGCSGGKDIGCNCCVQNCCCQPRTWGDALRRAGFQNSSLFAFLLVCGGDSLVDETVGYFARRRILAKYNIEESDFYSLFASCCCPPCARYQELNTIMVREGYRYGCASVVVPDPAPVVVPDPAPAPVQAVMFRGTGRRV